MIGKIVKNYGSLTLIRVVSRVFEFILKTYLIRTTLDKEILGHMVHLDLIVTTSLHIVKSCLKPAYQKVEDPQKVERNILSGMNLMNWGILITALSSITVCSLQIYHFFSSHSEKNTVLHFEHCIVIYGFAVLAEALFEKYNVKNVLEFSYVKCGLIEMASFLPKTLFIFVAAQLGWFSTYGILIFGIGHFIYSTLLFLFTFFTTEKKYRTISHQPITIGTHENIKCQQIQYLDPKTKQSAKQFSTLSILKLFLSQFEKISLVALDISDFSSVYSLISNLGSIVVRYFFAPLEEIVFNYFSRGEEKESIQILTKLVQSLLTFSCLCLTFGYNYSEVFLGFLYGQKWISEDSITALRFYTVLLAILGINGIMEAFLLAKADKSFSYYKYFSVFPTLVYVGASMYFMNVSKLGTGSFFLANSLSMVLRIFISWQMQVRKHISLTNFIAAVRPSWAFLIVLCITFCLGNESIGIQRFDSNLINMLIGGGLFSINIALVAWENRRLIKEKLINKLRQKSQEKRE